MEISSYKKNPQNFLSELDRVELKQLRGADSTALDELVALLKRENIKITATYDPNIDSAAFPDQVVTDNEALLRKLLAYFLPPDATIPGGIYDAQLKGGFENFKKIIMEAAAAGKRDFTLREFLAVTKFSLTPDRLDDDVIEVMTDAMFRHNSRRDALKENITDLTAELNIYSKITTEINKVLSASGTLSITNSGLNLMDPKLYGFSGVNEEKFYQSAEYNLLKKIRGSALAGVTIKQFLESPLKRTGALTGLNDSYAYNKDNNVLANFATTVNDRTRPLNDEVSQKTTELSDISSRYNSAIEALNRFIQKYESVMRDILQSI
ncbi:Virulence-associated V antigen [Aeromonas jandaei]|uniref:virulence-associated V antigen n=1 Tax=Aeromonas jandaei TaxID=650 RepID=UPI00366BB76A